MVEHFPKILAGDKQKPPCLGVWFVFFCLFLFLFCFVLVLVSLLLFFFFFGPMVNVKGRTSEKFKYQKNIYKTKDIANHT